MLVATLFTMVFDLHTHSDHSDGTEPPQDVMRAAAKAGLDGLALTDHDTTAGWASARATAEEIGITFIPGMEISCVSRSGISVHLLSYLHDPHNEGLLAEIELARRSRLERAEKMTELLAEDFPITWEQVIDQTGAEATVGRPHIADALVAAGVVPDRSAAFKEILRGGSKYYVPHYAPEPAETVELVREAGGVPIFAHPKAPSRGRLVEDDVFYDMLDAGLAGVEVYHRDNTEDGKQWLLKLAHDFKLLVTGSSDYHGTGKPNRLGEHSTGLEMVKAIEAQATSATTIYWA